jgi:glutamyl-tRNA synthetase
MVNTPPQILIYEALGGRVPEFAHLPMMLAQSGEKLSKRHGAVSVGEYRLEGYSPHAVLNYLARFGWSHGDQEVFSRSELVEAFSWEACGRGDGKFDPKKFLAIDHEHLKAPRLTPDAEYAKRVAPFLEARGIDRVDPAKLAKAVPTVRERAPTFKDAADRLDFYFREPVMDEKARAKFLTPEHAANLDGFRQAVAEVSPFSAKALEERITAWLAEKGLQIKDVAQPARVALTGRTASPGLYEVLEVLGRDESLARLEKGKTLAAGAAAS